MNDIKNQTITPYGETFIGVDIGKTKVAVGIIKQNGEIVVKDHLPTDMKKGGKAIIDQCRELIHRMLSITGIKPKGIGIGSSGVVDYKKGIILSSGSIPNWENIKIKKIFEKEFSLPVFVDNDVYVAALGEHFFGAGRGLNTSVYIVISTGIGFCIIYNGEIWRGAHNLAGQIAHIPLFGKKKTVNDIFSGKAISESVSKLMGYSITTKKVLCLALAGHREAQQVVDQAIEGAALTIAWIQNSIDPDVLIFGGGVAINNESFVRSIRQRAENFLTKYRAQLPKRLNVVRAKLGSDAGIIGAAVLCLHLKE
jgi:glucokinase